MGGIADIEKRHVLDTLLERLRADLAAIEASQQAAQSGATHEETQSEHPKDTRAIEAQYVARGLAERSEALRGAVAALSGLALDPVASHGVAAVTALVTLEDDATGAHTHYFLVPAGGGERLEIDGVSIQSLTPVSPLGRQLMGREVGDAVELERPRGALRAVLIALR